MIFVKAGWDFLFPVDGKDLLKRIELAARQCYLSEDAITEDSCFKMCKMLVERKHEAMLEHAGFTCVFVTDRGVTHEMVRHRIASFAQESTRYCDYSSGKFGTDMQFIMPGYWENCTKEDLYRVQRSIEIYQDIAERSEAAYKELRALGNAPQHARIVTLSGLKTKIIVTANVREWRHILDLRAVGSSGVPHPQMREVMLPLLNRVHETIPVLFDDIQYK